MISCIQERGVNPVVNSVIVKMLITTLTLILLVASCDAQERSDYESRVAEEEALAANDVWHAAKLRGVVFRAVGQEPGWLLEITEGESILLALNYGQDRNVYPYVEPVVYQDERRTEYIIDNTDLVIEIQGQHCTDTMSGESFEVTVIITNAEQQFKGCGRALY